MGKKKKNKGYLAKHKKPVTAQTITFDPVKDVESMDLSKMVISYAGRMYKCKQVDYTDFNFDREGDQYGDNLVEYYAQIMKGDKEKRYPFVDISMERFISYVNVSNMRFLVQHPEKMIMEYIKNNHLLPLIELPARFEEINILMKSISNIIMHNHDSGLFHSGAIIKELKNCGEYYSCSRKIIKALSIPSGLGVGEKFINAVIDNYAAIKRIITFRKSRCEHASFDFDDVILSLVNIAGYINTVEDYREFTDIGISENFISSIKSLDVRTCCMGDIDTLQIFAAMYTDELGNPPMYYTVQYNDNDLRYPDTSSRQKCKESDWSEPCFIVTNPYAIDLIFSTFSKDELLEIIAKSKWIENFVKFHYNVNTPMSGYRHNYKR